MRKNKKNSPIGTVLLVVLLFVLVAIAAVSGIKLYRYYADYAKDRDHYEDLRDEVVKEQTEAEQATLEEESDETEEENSTPKYRKKLRKRTKRASTAPLSIDWEELKAINKDIIGWVYFTGLPQISYRHKTMRTMYTGPLICRMILQRPARFLWTTEWRVTFLLRTL